MFLKHFCVSQIEESKWGWGHCIVGFKCYMINIKKNLKSTLDVVIELLLSFCV